MKKSHIAMLAAAGFIVVLMLIMMGLGRMAIGKSLDVKPGEKSVDWSFSGNEISETLDLKGFDSVVVEGSWTVRINRSDEFSTTLFYPSEMEDNIHVQVRANQLVLGTNDWRGHSDTDLKAEIHLPSLTEIRVEGAADIIFNGFDEEKMSLDIDGAANIVGNDSSVRNLSVNLDGLGRVDMTGVQAVNARVDLNGAGDIRLKMKGGVLDGSLDGMGNIVYSGTVSDEDISVEGLGRVRSE